MVFFSIVGTKNQKPWEFHQFWFLFTFMLVFMFFLYVIFFIQHCVKSVRIWSYSGPHFPTLRLYTERHGRSLRTQSKWGKMRTRIIPNMDTFHAVQDAAEYRTNTVCLFIFAFPTSSLREKCPNTIQRFSGPYFPAFGLNMEIYGVNLRIQSECRKIRTKKIPYLDTFHAVHPSKNE